MEKTIYWFDSLFDADRFTNKTATDRRDYDIEKLERYAKKEDELEESRVYTIAGSLRKQTLTA